MRDKQQERVKDIFGIACEMAPGERAAYLDEACAGDVALCAEVERLLASHDMPEGFIDFGPFELEPIQTFAKNDVLSGRFRIVKLVGRGGMGEVYEAEDRELGRRVALKTLRPELLGDERNLQRFKREIKMALAVTHPNLCRIHDVYLHRGGDGKELTFLSMEFLEGETLAEYLKRKGRLTAQEALPLVKQMCLALTALHDANVIHRDFKPGNVMLVPNAANNYQVVVTDFGLALPAASIASLKSQVRVSGQIVGTLEYMAPEQLSGRVAGPRTDVYALGVVLYEMTTGERPFPDADAWMKPPVPPRKIVPEIPRKWERLILACLNKAPSDRPNSVLEVFEAASTRRMLRPAGRNSGLSQPPNGWPDRVQVGRRVLLFGSAAAAAVAAYWLSNLDLWNPPTYRTDSREAARHYEQGLQANREGRFRQAVSHLEEALVHDRNFAIAYITLGQTLITLGRYEKGHECANEAYHLVSGKPDDYSAWDRYWVLARYCHLRKDYIPARDHYQALADFASETADRRWFQKEPYLKIAASAHRGRALAYSFQGSPGDALKEIALAKELDPGNPRHDVLASTFHVENGEPALALEASGRVARRSPDDVYPSWGEGLARLYLGDTRGAMAAFDRLANGGMIYGAWARLFRVQAMVYEGRWAEAIGQLARDIQADLREDNHEHIPRRRQWSAELSFLLGADTVSQMEKLADDIPVPQNIFEFRDAALLAAELGDRRLIQRLLTQMEGVERSFHTVDSRQGRAEPVSWMRFHVDHVRGEEARLAGRVDEAGQYLSEAAEQLGDGRSLRSLARLQRSQGRLDEAIETYERVLAGLGRILSQDFCPVWILTHLDLARCYRESGRLERAKVHYRRFLSLTERAPDAPKVRKAKAEIVSLGV